MAFDGRSRTSATYNPLDFLPKFHSTAVPTDLSIDRLDGIGFRRHYQVKFLVKSLNYPNCRAFHLLYLEPWWNAMGQSIENLESSSAVHCPGTRGDLILTYNLKEPIHYAKICHLPSFDMISEGKFFCDIHHQSAARLVVDPPNEVHNFRVARHHYCCSRVENISFRLTILGREAHF